MSSTGPVDAPETLKGTEEHDPHHDPRHAPIIPCLTIAYHPDTRRVGEQLRMQPLLVGKEVKLGRLEPAFTTARGVATDALSDPYLSRKPLVFRGEGGAVVIDPSGSGTTLRVDGAVVATPVTLSAAAIREGCVLQLADRVVVCLHFASMQSAQERPGELLGNAASMARVREEIARVAPEEVPVLLRGESGSGKELVAQAIHGQSRRGKGPFVAVNMGAMTETTAASELFGHTRGAFTGAATSHEGYFGAADGGTLFLDEIGETPGSVQPMLLRALESGEIQPVGGRASRRVNVRILAATDADLEDAIAHDTFRVALLHRLAGYEIHIPPARARREDLGPLFFHFLRAELERLGMAHRLVADPSAKRLWIPASLIGRICGYDWPGNVRQLKNVARQLAIASKGEDGLRLNDAVSRMLPAIPEGARPVAAGLPKKKRSSRANLDAITDEMVLEALRRHEWRIAATARDLQVSKNSLYQLIDRSGLIRRAKDLTEADIRGASEAHDHDPARMAVSLEVSLRGLKLRMVELGL